MKVFILSAGMGTRLKELGETVPKCLVPVENTTLLNRNVQLLKEYGLNDIVIIVGKYGKCWNEENYNKIKEIVPNMIINEENDKTFQAYSLYLGLKNNPTSSLLAIDGDVYFSKEALESILYAKQKNILLSRVASMYSEAGGKISIDSTGKIIYCGMTTPEHFPFDIYSGILKISNGIIEHLYYLLEQNKDKEILYNINLLCEKNKIYVKRVGYTFSSKDSGSYSSLYDMSLIRKQAINEGKEKLRDEINFIKSLPEDCKPYFSEIQNTTEKENYIAYDMKKYEMVSLRSLLLSGSVDYKISLQILDNILNFLFTKMYNRDIFETPEGYMDIMHFKRVWKRLKETSIKSEYFEKLISQEKVILNGVEYDNIPLALTLLENNTDIIKKCTPKFVTHWCHSDLHFSNFLVNLKDYKDFKFLDPRGYKYCDYYYDLGKIWHSVNGYYDFISEGLFSIKMLGENEYTYEVTDKDRIKEYIKIKENILPIFQKYSLEPKEQLLMKTEFNEAIHFCCFMPFFLVKDNNLNRALAGYLTGLRLINEFNKKYCKPFDSFININRIEHLEKVREILKKKD